MAPLSGLLVVDLTRHLPGPLAAHLLADLGARVVKIEEPALGDPVRHAPPRREGTGALAAILLSGVESVALDLKQPAARQVLEALLARADVLLESFRPGTLERLGFAPEELRLRYPRLIRCSISGWGQSGPYAARAGHDLTYQALAGSLAPTTPPSMPAVPVADLTGAWSAVTAILASLIEREKTGDGKRIDAALFDGAVHANLASWASEAGGAKTVGESLPLTGALPCYNLYRTAEGDLLALAALEPHFWERFCRAAGRPDLIRHQYRSRDRSRRKVAALIRRRTRAEWLDLLSREDIPAEMVLSAAEARAHPQARERGVLTDGPDSLPRLGFPVLLNGARPRAGDRVPELGEQTEAVLEELGMEKDKKQRGIGRRFSWKRLLARWL
ncbi:MAG TPA: CaiB/BaiF CoA-transferase family protein [Thermoanaerobaculia bacterium]|jgi:crotonobetainyl-CoA:carnitine CoA-transferase CaiB-like acyl-CoA transferase|nr:CaiB/BaiF CoA-transferase family protein [Thermoanaerobaculia bacterium]